MPLIRPGLPTVYHDGENKPANEAPPPRAPRPFLSPEMAKAAAEARAISAMPPPKVPVENPVPQ